MTPSFLRRLLIAGTLSAACTLGLGATMSAAAPKTVGIEGYAGSYNAKTPMRNTLTVYLTPTTITVRHFMGDCGEFTNIRGALKRGKFNVTRQFDNGFGIAFRGTASAAKKTISGQLRAWSPERPAVADDPATIEVDETQQAGPACDSGFMKMIRMKPIKGRLF